MTTPRVEWALTDLLIAQPGPAATALMRWLVTDEHVHGALRVDAGWLPPGVSGPAL